MKFVSYTLDNQAGFGVLRGEHEVIALNDLASDMVDFISKGQPALEAAKKRLESALVTLSIDDIELTAPIPVPPRNVMCLGRNYDAHAKESYAARGQAHEKAQFELIFTKATTSVTGPTSPIPFDPNVSEQIDYEAEMALVIGKRGKNISREEAFDYVFGYTVLNDVTARDLQDQHKQFFRGKSLDGACPMGPWLVSAEDVADPHDLIVRCVVNGEERQNGHTGDMIFDIPTIIATLSNGMTLVPGDIIATGTPEGVGFALNPPQFLRPGDVVECSVEGLGSIRNTVEAVE